MWAAMILVCELGTTNCYNLVLPTPLPSEEACIDKVYEGVIYYDGLGLDIKNYTCYQWETPT